MKNLKGVLVIVAVFNVFQGFTQLVRKMDKTGVNKMSLFIPESPVIPANSAIKKVSLNVNHKIPRVKLDPLKQFIEARNNCPLLNSTPSLKLDGERISGESVFLEWKLSNGYNGRGFAVERSFNDTFHFERVNYVWADNIAGFRDKYQLPDDNDYNKISYYRLKLGFNDASYIYSNIAKVKGYISETLKVYPNPARENVWLYLNANMEGTAQIKLYDAAGTIVFQQSAFLNKGMNVKSLDVKKLSAGLYSVRIDMLDNTFKTAKIIKH